MSEPGGGPATPVLRPSRLAAAGAARRVLHSAGGRTVIVVKNGQGTGGAAVLDAPEARPRAEALEVQMVPVKECEVHPDNPRNQKADDPELKELAASIREKSVLEPLLARVHPTKKCVQILAGSRRLRAARLAGVDRVPVRMLVIADEAGAVEVMLVENLQRKDVSPLEEADGYVLLRDTLKLSIEGIATKVGKSVGYVHGRLALTKLQVDVRKAWAAGKLELGHVQELAPLAEDAQQHALKWLTAQLQYERVTVKDLKAWLQHEVLLDLSAAPWKKDDADLYPKAGACNSCPLRSGAQAALFAGVKGDRCLSPACYAEKQERFIGRAVAAAEKEAGAPLPRVTTEFYCRAKGVLTDVRLVSSKNDRCPHVQAVLVVDVDHKGHVTPRRVAQGCVTLSCKKHRSNVDRSNARSRGQIDKRAAAERARHRTDERQRDAWHAALLEKAKWPVPRGVLVELAIARIGHLFHEGRKELRELHGVKGDSWSRASPAWVEGLKDDALARLLVTLCVADARPNSFTSGGFKAPFQRLGKALKVDLAAVFRAAEKAAAAAKKGKRTQSRAAARGRKAAA